LVTTPIIVMLCVLTSRSCATMLRRCNAGGLAKYRGQARSFTNLYESDHVPACGLAHVPGPINIR
jgi:hypothetical protein